MKFLTRLCLGFSHLNEHRFQHNFQDFMNPLCSCSLDIGDTSLYFLHCYYFSQHHIDLMNSVKSILESFQYLPENVKKDILLYGESRLDGNKNKFILEAPLTYIESNDRFSGSIFD